MPSIMEQFDQFPNDALWLSSLERVEDAIRLDERVEFDHFEDSAARKKRGGRVRSQMRAEKDSHIGRPIQWARSNAAYPPSR
jgi:hypothetical protein